MREIYKINVREIKWASEWIKYEFAFEMFELNSRGRNGFSIEIYRFDSK